MSAPPTNTNPTSHNKLLDGLDALVSDEVLRTRVRRMIDEPTPASVWVQIAKHPLTSLLVGFALTWGVGTLLTNKWEQVRTESQKQAERARQEHDTRLSVLGEFFGILFEHSAQAFLVQRAVDRNAPVSELRDIVRTERELFAKSNARLGLVYFNLRSLLERNAYERIVKAVDNGMYVPLQLIDQVHATAYEDKLLSRRPPKGNQSGSRKSTNSLVSSN